MKDATFGWSPAFAGDVIRKFSFLITGKDETRSMNDTICSILAGMLV